MKSSRIKNLCNSKMKLYFEKQCKAWMSCVGDCMVLKNASRLCCKDSTLSSCTNQALELQSTCEAFAKSNHNCAYAASCAGELPIPTSELKNCHGQYKTSISAFKAALEECQHSELKDHLLKCCHQAERSVFVSLSHIKDVE